MKNKVLINIYIPELDISYDLFIPVNEMIWRIKILIVNALKSLNNLTDNDNEYILINKQTSKIYNNNEVVINTDIRNGTELLLIKNR